MYKGFLSFFCLICFTVLLGQPIYSYGDHAGYGNYPNYIIRRFDMSRPEYEIYKIHEAIRKGDKEEVIRLIEQGVDIQVIDVRLLTLFPMRRELTGIIQFFCLRPYYGKPMTEMHNCGVTPLHLAAIQGYTDIALMLVDRGANINAIDGNSFTVLDYASFGGHTDTLHTLKQIHLILSLNWNDSNFSP